ncbi:MAG: zinc-ribbon domain-containing protein [Clostridium sp.]|nr:zinc-ribbon domain-containing protein [Clostridium sp.]
MAFFEQLGKTLNEASDNLKRKTQNFSEVNSLEKQVNANQSAVQNLYVEIGRAYYEAHKGDMQGDYAEQCRMITDALNQIAQLQNQIRVKKGIQLCPNCGAQLTPGSMFCAGCGAQVAQPAPQQPTGSVAQQAPVQQPTGSVAPQAPAQPMDNAAPQAPAQPADTAAPQAPVQPADHAAPQAANTKVCGQCGSQIPADSAFCPVCGQRI